MEDIASGGADDDAEGYLDLDLDVDMEGIETDSRGCG